jgi:hypothetical protein
MHFGALFEGGDAPLERPQSLDITAFLHYTASTASTASLILRNSKNRIDIQQSVV